MLYDEITAIFRSHGLDPGPIPSEDTLLLGEVKLAAVAGGGAFSLAPLNWQQPLPDSVRWYPLVDHPIVRRTWAVWPADSHRHVYRILRRRLIVGQPKAAAPSSDAQIRSSSQLQFADQIRQVAST